VEEWSKYRFNKTCCFVGFRSGPTTCHLPLLGIIGLPTMQIPTHDSPSCAY